MEFYKVSRRSIKIVLSVSLFSLLFLSLPLLFQFLNQFSINKSYVFLFCNGLMVFIAKNSALPSDHSSSYQFKGLDVAAAPVNSHDSPEQEQEEEEEKRMTVAADSQEEDDVADAEKEDEGADAEKEWVDETEREDEVADTETKEEGEGSNTNGVWIREEEEEHEEVEELNKKCEDFIRKMKAAFCSEPRQEHGYYSDFDHHTAMVTVR